MKSLDILGRGHKKAENKGDSSVQKKPVQKITVLTEEPCCGSCGGQGHGRAKKNEQDA